MQLIHRSGLVVAAVLALSGCATNRELTTSTRPGAGLAEYSRLVEHSRAEVESAWQRLETLGRHQGPCPAPELAAFSKMVDQLAVESLRVRARSEALLKRGDAYFENWYANLAHVADPAIRDAAEAHRTELQQGFAKVKLFSQQIREPFQAFLTGLRKVRSAVEADPNALQADSTKEWVRQADRSVRQVQSGLDAIAVELALMSQMIVPNKAAAMR